MDAAPCTHAAPTCSVRDRSAAVRRECRALRTATRCVRIGTGPDDGRRAWWTVRLWRADIVNERAASGGEACGEAEKMSGLHFCPDEVFLDRVLLAAGSPAGGYRFIRR